MYFIKMCVQLDTALLSSEHVYILILKKKKKKSSDQTGPVAKLNFLLQWPFMTSATNDVGINGFDQSHDSTRNESRHFPCASSIKKEDDTPGNISCWNGLVRYIRSCLLDTRDAIRWIRRTPNRTV